MCFEKHGSSQKKLVSQYMRIMARLLIQLRLHTKSETASLEDFILPEKFDIIIEVVHKMALHSTGERNVPEFKCPSLALKIGHHLMKCAYIVRGKSLRNRNRMLERDVLGFIDLYKLEWEARVSFHAHSTLNEKRQRSPELLPCTEDLQKLAHYQQEEMNRLSQELNDNPSSSAWLELAEHTLTKLTVFNKRRGGEASKILVSDYVGRPAWHEGCIEEFEAVLSPLEKYLCKRLELIRVVGKLRNAVPVLLTPELVAAIEILIKYRKDVGVHKDNKFLFPRVYGGSLDHLKTWDCLRQIAMKANLKNADRIQSTKLRKYVATVSQVFCLETNEMDWLAKHLGHDIRTHRNYYRLHDSTVEMAKVSKLLIALESSNPSSWKGKSLDSIDLSPDIVLDEEGEGDPTSTVGMYTIFIAVNILILFFRDLNFFVTKI